MALVLLDAPTGLAGNMLLAALLDLGLPESAIHGPLAALGLQGRYRLQLEERRSAGLRGLHLAVESLEREPPHRHWQDLRSLLIASALEPRLRERVLAVFRVLAEAEAAVHGHPPEQVHFHEVGALDALVDIVGVCAGLLHFDVDTLICTVPPAGHGSVATAHGWLPVPAPAVLEIARSRGIPLASSGTFPPGELTTPTGLALVACWAASFGPAPAAIPQQIGVGLGSRALDRPNLLRLVLARPVEGADPLAADGDPAGPGERPEPLLLQQAQIDDASAEDLAFLAEALRQAGAVEVFSQAILMKKGRPGTLLSALVPPDLAPQLRAVWWRHGTTLGVREQRQQRWRLPRESFTLATPLGVVRLKRAWLPGGGERCKPEYEDLAALAHHHGVSLQQVRAVVAESMAGATMESRP
jgi:uncharacterized protein (TIGR00299 family) protein